MYDIPASVSALPTGAGNERAVGMPVGAQQGITDDGAKSYGGPCPPTGHGVHHYVFSVFALRVETLEVPDNASSALIGFNLNGNALAKASFAALHSR